MRFLDIRTDFAFKKVFGSEQSKALLTNFLNAILYGGQPQIVDLKIVDPYQVPLIKGMKDSYVDVKAKLVNGTTVIIEMQVLSVQGFEKRVLYNAAKAYSTQLSIGEGFNLLNPVIAVTITDFVMFPELSSELTYFKLLEKNRLLKYSDDIELVFVELPKFRKTESELMSLADKWIYFLQCAGSVNYVPDTLAGEEAIQQAFQIASIANLNLEELQTQSKKMEYITMQRMILQDRDVAVQERNIAVKEKEVAIKEKEVAVQEKEVAVQEKEVAVQEMEMVKQRAKESEQKLAQVIQQLLKSNLPVALIAQTTGLTEAEIERLKLQLG